MPYPLLKLQYGLQQRLRSLSTPKEAYFLQIATGFEKHYLQPLQMRTNVSTVTDEPLRLHRMDGNIVLTTIMYWLFTNKKVFDWKNGALTYVDSYLELISLRSEDYDSPVFNALLIECCNLKLFQSRPYTAKNFMGGTYTLLSFIYSYFEPPVPIEHSTIVEPPKVYPLSKFAYSFQRRLRELATPTEAYHLQVADVDDTVFLNPKIDH
uniref:Glycosyltransferase family 2 protein n=1 Tax=Panagrellus redivivus TaxID=6233 RepID=A0A7E4W0N7_PANRE